MFNDRSLENDQKGGVTQLKQEKQREGAAIQCNAVIRQVNRITKITELFLTYAITSRKVMERKIPMQRQNRLFVILTAALMLVVALSVMGGSASESSPNAPKPKTPTPPPIIPSPTPG